jgi:ankyrin repeat protein
MTFLRFLIAAGLVAAASAQTGPSGEALLAAVRNGAVDEAATLLQAGADPDVADADGVSALMQAVLFAGADMVELLLQRGADPNHVGPAGTTALMWAAPDPEKVRRLLARRANVHRASDSGRTALLVAAAIPRSVETLRLLLDAGADLKAQDRAGATALALAVRSADIDVVRLLVGRGLDPDALSVGARRAALARYDRPTTDFLLSGGGRAAPDLLITTATWHPPELVARAIELGADVNAVNAGQYGRTPLMTAVTSEAEGAETLELLLDRGANPNARTTEGETALDWAIYKGDRAKIQVLERSGAARGSGPRGEEIPPIPPGPVPDARMAAGRGVARLLEVAPKFRAQAGCISCHHNAMPAIAAGRAARRGLGIDQGQARRNLDDILTFFKGNAPRMMLGDPAVGGEALTTGYALLGLEAAGHPPDAVTATMAHWLMARQMPDGRWLGNGLNRPPSEYSTISHTAVAAGGLAAYPLPGRRGEAAAALRRARDWLLAARPASAEERGMRLMGLVWTGASRARVEEAIGDVRAQQDAGGGWSQFSRTDPDAYATGLSLYALHLAGVPAADEAYRRGVAFLLRTQYPDGAWLVRTHAFPVQRYFESGFPFGRHQWISASATGWAVAAIAESLVDR